MPFVKVVVRCGSTLGFKGMGQRTLFCDVHVVRCALRRDLSGHYDYEGGGILRIISAADVVRRVSVLDWFPSTPSSSIGRKARA